MKLLLLSALLALNCAAQSQPRLTVGRDAQGVYVSAFTEMGNYYQISASTNVDFSYRVTQSFPRWRDGDGCECVVTVRMNGIESWDARRWPQMFFYLKVWPYNYLYPKELQWLFNGV